MEALTLDPKFWVGVSAILFAIAFCRFGLKPVVRMLDAKRAKIRDELNEAKILREQAEEILATYQKRQKEVMAEAQQMVELAREEAEHMKRDAERELETMIQRRTEQANAKIARAEAKAMQDLKDHLVELAVAAARDVLVARGAEADDKAPLALAPKDLARIVH